MKSFLPILVWGPLLTLLFCFPEHTTMWNNGYREGLHAEWCKSNPKEEGCDVALAKYTLWAESHNDKKKE